MNPTELSSPSVGTLPRLFNEEDLGRFDLTREEIQNRADASIDPVDVQNLPRLKLSEWNWNLVNPRHKYAIKQAIFITLSAMAATATPWKIARVWGAVVLSAVGYGIINDLFACRVCPEYFTVGHVYDGQRTRWRLVNTLDPNVNAVAWGMVATSTLAALGGAIVSFGAFMSGASEKAVIISMLVHTALTLVIADVGSRIEKGRIEKKPSKIYFDVPDQLQSRWHANNVRNSIGYISLIAGVIAISVLMISGNS